MCVCKCVCACTSNCVQRIPPQSQLYGVSNYVLGKSQESTWYITSRRLQDIKVNYVFSLSRYAEISQ